MNMFMLVMVGIIIIIVTLLETESITLKCMTKFAQSCITVQR